MTIKNETNGRSCFAHAQLIEIIYYSTDASEKDFGAILEQRKHLIIYLSRKFSETGKSFRAIEKEHAAIIIAVKKTRQYIDG